MPVSQVVAYQENDGAVPFLEWLATESAKVQLKTVAALRKLEQFGYELHRPHADYLRDDIYELRFKDGRRNIRVLYFFAGRNIVVLSHGLAKTDVVPPREIDLAIRRRQRFQADAAAHTASLAMENDGDEHEED